MFLIMFNTKTEGTPVIPRASLAHRSQFLVFYVSQNMKSLVKPCIKTYEVEVVSRKNGHTL